MKFGDFGIITLREICRIERLYDDRDVFEMASYEEVLDAVKKYDLANISSDEEMKKRGFNDLEDYMNARAAFIWKEFTNAP